MSASCQYYSVSIFRFVTLTNQCWFCLFQSNFMAGGAHFGMHTPPDSLPSSPLGAFSPFGAFPFSPVSPADSESSLSPIRPSYRTSVFPRCQGRQIGLPPATLQPEMPSVGSLFADPRWAGVNPLFGMWNDPTGFDYMQQQGLTQLLSGNSMSCQGFIAPFNDIYTLKFNTSPVVETFSLPSFIISQVSKTSFAEQVHCVRFVHSDWCISILFVFRSSFDVT